MISRPPIGVLRLAAIDAGSNAIRFVVGDFACSRDSAAVPPDATRVADVLDSVAVDPPDTAGAAVPRGSAAILPESAVAADPLDYSVVARLRFPVRLGRGVFTHGSLDEGAMEEAVVAFRRFRAEMDRLGVDSYRAVATSATREANNRDRFLDRIHQESDIVLEPIDGREEARLVHLAASRRVDFSRGRWALVDLGGGSVEVSLVNHAGILCSESYRVGTVRLLETMEAAAGCSDTVREWVERELCGLAIPDAPAPMEGLPAHTPGALPTPIPDLSHSTPNEPDARGPLAFAATGGNAESIAKLALSYVDPLRVAVLSKRRLDAVVHLLAAMTVRERIERLGLRPDRADVVLPAALVYQRFAELAAVDRIVVPNAGVKEGVLLDLAARRRPTFEGAAQGSAPLRAEVGRASAKVL